MKRRPAARLPCITIGMIDRTYSITKRLVDIRKALHDHERKLLEGQSRAVGVNGRDQPGCPLLIVRRYVNASLPRSSRAECGRAQPQRRFAQVCALTRASPWSPRE